MEKEIPVHKEHPLDYLKETLTNALSTIDRMQKEENPVLERQGAAVDSWGVKVTVDTQELLKRHFNNKTNLFSVGMFYGFDKKGYFKWFETKDQADFYFDKVLTTEEFYNKIGYKKEYKKEVLFTTEDGVDIYRLDSYYSVCDNFIVYYTSKATCNPVKERSFSTKGKAEEYLLMNKPLLSLNNLLSVWDEGKQFNEARYTPQFKAFLELAKLKLNNK